MQASTGPDCDIAKTPHYVRALWRHHKVSMRPFLNDSIFLINILDMNS